MLFNKMFADRSSVIEVSVSELNLTLSHDMFC